MMLGRGYLRLLRDGHGLNLQGAAFRCLLSDNRWDRLERGDTTRDITAEELKRIATGMDEDYVRLVQMELKFLRQDGERQIMEALHDKAMDG